MSSVNPVVEETAPNGNANSVNDTEEVVVQEGPPDQSGDEEEAIMASADDQVLLQDPVSDTHELSQEQQQDDEESQPQGDDAPRSDHPSENPPPGTDGVYFDALSLDGRSLVFPNQGGECDDMSSINTDHYHIPPDEAMKILGQVEPEYQAPLQDHSSKNNNNNSNKQSVRTSSSHKILQEPSIMKMTDNSSLDSQEYNEDHGTGCLPYWIAEAPRCVKLVIALSVLLLLGAISMVGVGAALAMDKHQQEANNVFAFSDTQAPTVAPTTRDGTDVQDLEGSETASPISSPTEHSSSTSGPTAAPIISSKVTFYLTGGRFIDDALTTLPDQLASLPNTDGHTVMFHLGDWNSPFATECDEQSYQTNVDLYSNSTVPVYFVPGDNEYNDCPDPEEAFSFWEEYILRYETKFWPAPTLWNVTRQEPDYAENFAYVFNGVLFVGVHLVGGTVHDPQEWQDRQRADLAWIDEQYFQNEGKFEIMVVVAHADPSVDANSIFFDTFFDNVESNYDHQVVFIHRNLGTESWSLETQYQGIANLMLVVVEGSVWPPMRMQIDTKVGTVDMDQSEWDKSKGAKNK